MDTTEPIESAKPTLIPAPKHLARHDGAWTAHDPVDAVIAIDDGIDVAHRHFCLVTARRLRDDLNTVTGRQWSISAGHGRKASVVLEVDPTLATGTIAIPDHAHSLDGIAKRVDAYRLTVGTSGIVITGADIAGLRCGVQTLRQLVRLHGAAIPTMTIDDWSDMPIRALSYDVSRGRVPTLDTLKQLAETLCLYKYNQLQLYVEHVVDFDNTREAWKGNDPLTAEEILELDDHCADLGIELVPELATFGHMYDILRTRRFRGLGEHPEWADRPFGFVERMLHHTLNPVDPEATAFIERRIDDYAALFRSEQFNIGADETFDLGTGTSAEAAREAGVPKLYAGHVGRLCEHLESRGRRPMMYADIPIKHPELLGTLPHDVLLANWDYLPHPNEDNIRAVATSGYAQVVCPGVQTWNRLLPDLDSAWTNITEMCVYGYRYGAQGVVVTDWGDYGHINDPMMSLPGMLVGAECAWNGTGETNRDAMDRSISRLAFGDTTGTFVERLREAAHAQTFSWADMVQYKELDDHGAASHDVLFVLGHPSDETLAQARSHFLEDRASAIERTDAANDALASFAAAMVPTAPTVWPDTGYRTTATLMAEGQRLFNLIGAWLYTTGNVGKDHCQNGVALADAIERWLVGYDARWRAIGKEAGLKRIHDVLDWYTHLLRGGVETATTARTTERVTA